MRQDNFSGGMSAMLDATKTPHNQYRAALNVRIRRNAIEPAYRHQRIQTPAYLHQAVFSVDDMLVLMIKGTLYRLTDDNEVRPVKVTGLSETADRIYHATVPAPTNYFVMKPPGTRQYVSTVSTTPLVAVLQDGLNQPRLFSSSLRSVWTAKTYGEWTFDAPEYVPIGKQMAFTGTKLFIASPDGLKVFQSVSGRPLDFVLNFDDTGTQQGDAASTSLSVATAPLTALLPSQEGGFVASTLYKTYVAQPIDGIEIFGEVYLRPSELFPIGAVSQWSYTTVKGETVFVAPAGIQMFNQTQQLKRESNNSPMGWPILSYLQRPVSTAACVTVDDYSFFAVQTVFGPGIIVYDNVLECFVGIDITDSLVKEFALLQKAGVTRLFYITEGDELYEIPLYSGEKATATVYFGEWVPAGKDDKVTPARRHSIDRAVVGLSNVSTAGYLTGRAFTDKQESGYKVVAVDLDAALEPTATAFPVFTEMPSAAYPLSFPDQQNGYAIGLRLDLSADARIVSLDVALQDVAADAPREVTVFEPQVYAVIGNLAADARYTADFTAEYGQALFIESTSSSSDGSVLNGDQKIIVRSGHQARAITPRADMIYLAGSAAVYDFTTADGLLKSAAASTAFLLGAADGTDTYGAAFELFNRRGLAVKAVASDYIMSSTPRAADFFGLARVPIYYLVEERDIDFYCITFSDSSTVPADLNPTSTIAFWLRNSISSRASARKVNIVMCCVSPIANAQFSQWPFAAMGVDCVITAGLSGPAAAYSKQSVDGTPIITMGVTGAAMKIESTPRAAILSYYDATGTTDTTTLVS